MFLNKRERIINKAISKTVAEFSNRTPKIYQHFFYGAFDLAPQNLAIWYLFETDVEYEEAHKTGLCNELVANTIHNLISCGYPEEALEKADIYSKPYKFEFRGEASEEDLNYIRNAKNHRTVHISFTTQEDIDRMTNGDYHLYFQ